MKPFEQLNLDEFLVDRPEEGAIRVDRAIFTDPDIFELEMERIFGRAWLLLGRALIGFQLRVIGLAPAAPAPNTAPTEAS